MTKKTLSRCLTTIGMLAFAISMALPAAALEDRALPTYPCPKCGTTMTTSVETGYEFFTTPCIHGNVNARDTTLWKRKIILMTKPTENL